MTPEIRTLADDEKIKILSESLIYDAASGLFEWRARPLTHFLTTNARERWNGRFAKTPALCSNDRGYMYGRLGGKKVYAHRAAWALTHGYFPAEIDHMNGNPSDNRLANLRPADRFKNNCNVRSAVGSSSQFLGVYWSEKDQRWVAHITKNRVKTVLGYFKNEEDAAVAYDNAALKVHGEFARPNFGGSASCRL